MPASVYSRLGQSTITAPDQTSRQHVVHGGETAQSIAAYEYPDLGYRADLWRNIADANEITDLDAIVVGQILAIPAPAASET